VLTAYRLQVKFNWGFISTHNNKLAWVIYHKQDEVIQNEANSET